MSVTGCVVVVAHNVIILLMDYWSVKDWLRPETPLDSQGSQVLAKAWSEITRG